MRYFINQEKEGWVSVSWSSFGRLEEPKISHESVCFSSIGEGCGSVSDCEGLVGVNHTFNHTLLMRFLSLITK